MNGQMSKSVCPYQAFPALSNFLIMKVLAEVPGVARDQM